MNKLPPLPEVSADDRARLEPHLSGWTHLHEMFQGDFFTCADLEKMVVLEMNGKARKEILTRLVARLYSKSRKELHNRISSWLGQKKHLRQKLQGGAKQTASSTGNLVAPLTAESLTVSLSPPAVL